MATWACPGLVEKMTHGWLITSEHLACLDTKAAPCGQRTAANPWNSSALVDKRLTPRHLVPRFPGFLSQGQTRLKLAAMTVEREAWDEALWESLALHQPKPSWKKARAGTQRGGTAEHGGTAELPSKPSSKGHCLLSEAASGAGWRGLGELRRQKATFQVGSGR